MQLGFIFSLIFAIIITIFAIQNSAAVNINFLFTNVEISQALVIFVSAICGAIIVAILGFYKNLKVKISLKKANKDLKVIEDENNDLKSKINDLESSLSVLNQQTISEPENKLVETEEIDHVENTQTIENIETEKNLEY
ncbi:hypothetical protein SH2C18_11720 [Clostridium sediminicola]|uniref:LapA family protein n=1 Tax=Clostridium sediminicola TaxID=3114879 RepID=UPI0031F202CE